MKNIINVPWEASKDLLGWCVRDSEKNLVFIAQYNIEAEQKEACLTACVAVNNAFAYMSQKSHD